MRRWGKQKAEEPGRMVVEGAGGQASPELHALTMKKSVKRGTWQLKGHDHTIVSLHWMHPIIEAILPRIGIDPDDRAVVVKLTFSDRPFEGALVTLERRPETESPLVGRAPNLYGSYYRIARSAWGPLDAGGHVPAQIGGRFGEPPTELHMALERTTGAIFID